MKKTILCFYFLVLISSIFSLDLSGTTWGPEKGGFGFYLKFKTEKDFEYLYSGEGGGQNVLGTYIQDGNNITLTTVTINEWGDLPAYIKQKAIRCKIEETNSVFSRYKLIGNGGLELWSITYKPEKGDKRIIDGKVVYSYMADGKVTDNARIREGPGLQYKYYSFRYYEEYEEGNYRNFYNVVPKGYGIKIFGHSENKTEIDGKEDNWYYCKFRMSMWEDQFGWIWGGLIDFK